MEVQIETVTQQESMDTNDDIFGTDRNRIRVGKIRMIPEMSKSECQINTGYKTESGVPETNWNCG